MTARSWTVEPGPSGPIRSEAFRAVFRRHPAGVAVVALVDDGQPVGFTATSVISVSAEPPVLAFSVADTSSSWPPLSRAATVTINFLAADQVDISARFATKGIDRFAGVGWSWLPTGEPVLLGVTSWIRGQVLQRTAVGSSFLVAVQALEVHQGESVPPLVYHDRGYHRVDGDSAL
jgi:flavin reductase (DIM6/NTAB) family NADH-FMN oxidoreductase RutF